MLGISMTSPPFWSDNLEKIPKLLASHKSKIQNREWQAGKSSKIGTECWGLIPFQLPLVTDTDPFFSI